METVSVSKLKEQAGSDPRLLAVMVELSARNERQTKAGKPYHVLTLADAGGSFSLNIWSDSPVFSEAGKLTLGTVLRVQAEWTQNQYGLSAEALKWERARADQVAEFYAGTPELAQVQARAWEFIRKCCTDIRDPRLAALSEKFLDEYGGRFRRAAAARKNHHARRGGLVEHVARMMQSAVALCGVYPELNRDLLVAGVLLHDCGKMWENQYPETGFSQKISIYGEMLGHIPLGIELTNKLWQEIMDRPEASGWLVLEPPTDTVRVHLLHLIAAHHGQLEFGSPTLPRTPEAFALHHIDNLDAKLEMVHNGYRESQELAPGIYDRHFPLPANLVAPLPHFGPDGS